MVKVIISGGKSQCKVDGVVVDTVALYSRNEPNGQFTSWRDGIYIESSQGLKPGDSGSLVLSADGKGHVLGIVVAGPEQAPADYDKPKFFYAAPLPSSLPLQEGALTPMWLEE
jgi:hypothetical protein